MIPNVPKNEFNIECTHIILPLLLRTKKYLCGCASGKWILKPEYLFESEKANEFLDEAQFEWNNDETIGKIYCASPKISRLRYKSNHNCGIIHGLKAFVYGDCHIDGADIMYSFIMNVIEAGGGEVTNLLSETDDLRTFDFVIADENIVADSVIIDFRKLHIPFVTPNDLFDLYSQRHYPPSFFNSIFQSKTYQ